jgi:hypothetical protein
VDEDHEVGHVDNSAVCLLLTLKEQAGLVLDFARSLVSQPAMVCWPLYLDLFEVCFYSVLSGSCSVRLKIVQ